MALAHRQTYAAINEQERMKKESEANKEVLRLRQEIKSAIGNLALFDALMDNLFGEYCAECLLSIVEFIQFKNKMKSEFEDIEFIDDEEIMIELPEKMAQSKIVYEGDDYKEIASQLYEKYIRVGSEWEININYRDRNKYIQLFEVNGVSSDDKQELYVIFDICIKQMFGLLFGTFTRFKNSEQYKLINHHSPRNVTQVAWSE